MAGKKIFLFLAVFLVLSLFAGLSLAQTNTLKVTSEHPFLVNNKWIPAKQLQVGDILKTIDGKTARITGIKDIVSDEVFPVYNLEASPYNDFVVEDGLIVHNSMHPYYFEYTTPQGISFVSLSGSVSDTVVEFSLSPAVMDKIKIIEAQRRTLLSAFKRAACGVPAYKQVLKEHGLTASGIKSIEDFLSRVPVIDKTSTFSRFELSELCMDGNLEGIVFTLKSSGFSSVPAYGVMTAEDVASVRYMADPLLDSFFGTSAKKTMVINALPTGVEIPTSLPVASPHVKIGMVIAEIKANKQNYQQFVVFSSPYMAKESIEVGIANGINWKEVNPSFMVGGEWSSNSFVNYLKSMTGGDVLNTMGSSELGLNLFHDSHELSRLRNLIQNDPRAMKLLFGDLKTCPEIMYWYPKRNFIEVMNPDGNGFGELVFTTLEDAKLPLIRYNSRDIGKILSNNDFKQKLASLGYDVNLEFDRPIMAVIGRNEKVIINGKLIMPQDVNEAIYRDFILARKITGQFKLSSKGVEIQLKGDVISDQEIRGRIEKALRDFFDSDVPIKVYEYNKFPYGVEKDYETKFKFT